MRVKVNWVNYQGTYGDIHRVPKDGALHIVDAECWCQPLSFKDEYWLHRFIN